MPDTTLSDFAAASAVDLVAALAARSIGALELTDAAIARIEALDGEINAVVVRDFDRAREAARAADAALSRGERAPLLGLPMSVKESHNVAGLPTTWGFEEFRDWRAPADSLGVSRLKAAGAIILGKTNIPPALADWQSANPIHGRTRNPWDLTRTPGGSSGGGAAALATGMVPLEFGSDIGGSVRIPAAFCGVYGHKPTHGLIPSRGHAPPTRDGGEPPISVVGPLARTAADLELALDILAGPAAEEAVAYRLDLPPARHARLADFRVLVIDSHPCAGVESEISERLAVLAQDLSRAGARVAHGSDLLPDLEDAHRVYMDVLVAVMSRRRPPEPNGLSAHAWMGLLEEQTLIRRKWAAVFQAFDVVLTPVLGVVAFPHIEEPDVWKRTLRIDGAEVPYRPQIAWPGMATLAHLPATAAPMGMTRGGLPIGVQIIGPCLEDRTPLAFARLLEREYVGYAPPPVLKRG